MDLLVWLLLLVMGAFAVHYFEKKQWYSKERISAGLEFRSVWVTLVDKPEEVKALRSALIDVDRQIMAEGYRFVGATQDTEFKKLQIHYVSSLGDIVVTLREKELGSKGEAIVEFGSETTSGEFHLTSDVGELMEIELPAALNIHYAETSDTISKKLEVHKMAMDKFELNIISNIDDVVAGINRMHSIAQAHEASKFY